MPSMKFSLVVALIGLLVSGGALFAEPRSEESSATAGERFVLGAGGDMMFGRYHHRRFRPHGGADPFEHLKTYLHPLDLAVLSLETPLMDGLPERFKKGLWGKRNGTFRADTRYAALLKAGGVDVVSLATNHSEDCRDEGIRQTVDALDEAGVWHAGMKWEGDPYKPTFIYRKNTMVIFASISMRRNLGRISADGHKHVAFLDTKGAMRWAPEQIALWRDLYPKALIVLAVHWGEEYGVRPYPTQVAFARAAIDAGANAILGHYSHVLQPVEVYNDGVILYSMGSFIFDMFREEGRKSALFEVAFERGERGAWGVDRLVVHPLKLVGLASGTRGATSAEADVILRELQKRSATRHETAMKRVDDRLIWQAK